MPSPTYYAHMHRDLGNGRFIVLHGLYYEDRKDIDHEAFIHVGEGSEGYGGVSLSKIEHTINVRASQLETSSLTALGVDAVIATDIVREARTWFTIEDTRKNHPL